MASRNKCSKAFFKKCSSKRQSAIYGIVTRLLDRNNTAVSHGERRQKC